MDEAFEEDSYTIGSFFCNGCKTVLNALPLDGSCPRCFSGLVTPIGDDTDDNSSGINIGSENVEGDVDVTGLDPPDHREQDQDAAQISEQRVSASWVPGAGRRGFSRGSPYERSATESHNFSLTVQCFGYRRDHLNRIRRSRPRDITIPIDSIFHNYFVNHPGVEFRLVHQEPGGRPIVMLGNTRDYRRAVLNLLHPGPPPLSRERIDELPLTTVSQIQVDNKLKCTVCREDFNLIEPVKQLPCEHIYHELCIVPWLELHGTCPICRHNLAEENTDEANQDVGPSSPALSSDLNESSSSSSEATSSRHIHSSDDSSDDEN